MPKELTVKKHQRTVTLTTDLPVETLDDFIAGALQMRLNDPEGNPMHSVRVESVFSAAPDHGHYEELKNIVRNWPVFAGDVISKDQVKFLESLGWIKRDDDGDWMPTKQGLHIYKQVAG